MTAGMMAMEHAGYILGSYAITLATIGALAAAFVRRGRRLAESVDDADKYWT